MADEHFFPSAGDFPYGLGASPFIASSHTPPPGLDAIDAAAAMMQGFSLPWPDLHLPDSAAAAATAHFDSALSSLVSSPSHNAGDDVAIGDLIGRLGSICNAAASATNSCYSTPLSSPPRAAPSPASAAAAALSFRGGGGGRMSRVASSKSLGAGVATSMGSPVENTSPTTGCASVMLDDPAAPAAAAKGHGCGAARKRKASSGKGKATSAAAAAEANGSPKRSKVAEDGEGDGAATAAPAAAEEPEPVKDYIHVRARRGQATDSHSLAERVRRERISERMKMLESLVPGCNKITGKALMLDEIINYVQSLQRQVEFLSMKLATMNPELDAETRYQTAAAMVASSAPATAAFSPYAAGFPAQLLVDSCAAATGWDQAQDLQSVVACHNAAAVVHGHDFYSSPSPPAHSSFHGQEQQQGCHMKSSSHK